MSPRVIRVVTALMRPLAAANHVTLVEELPSQVRGIAIGDNQALRQVLLNLVANGIKYNRPGGTVTVRIADTPPGRVRVDVADTGRGIAEQDLKAIFTPFERLGAARTVEGTGLGLGISRQLVEAMGGSVSAESLVGTGTTLSMALSASGRAVRPEATVALPSHLLAGAGAPRTVLYVEDNIVNIELMQSFFTRLRPGIALVSTMLGELAVDLARGALTPAHPPRRQPP